MSGYRFRVVLCDYERYIMSLYMYYRVVGKTLKEAALGRAIVDLGGLYAIGRTARLPFARCFRRDISWLLDRGDQFRGIQAVRRRKYFAQLSELRGCSSDQKRH